MKYRQWKKNYKKKYGAVKCRRLETGCLPEKYNRRRISGHISQNQIHVTVSADRTDLVTLEAINGERYILVKADGDINANGILLENREGEKDEEEDD